MPELVAPISQHNLPSNWTPFICTWESLMMVWEKLNQFPILFDDDVRGDLGHFVKSMTSKDSIILITGDYGICEISKIVPYRDCQIHVTFWDRRFRGRDIECVMTLKWVFQTLQLHRATIRVVSIAHSTINFVKALGFKREGVVREKYLYKGRFLDIHLFGILRDDVFKTEEQDATGERDYIRNHGQLGTAPASG